MHLMNSATQLAVVFAVAYITTWIDVLMLRNVLKANLVVGEVLHPLESGNQVVDAEDIAGVVEDLHMIVIFD